jgi:glycerol-3-phosphate dehydrogenase subunit C
MREGSLDAPTRHALAWDDPAFTDPAALDAEMRRVFDICHGCRRCFNLCDSFPRLFDLIDQSPSEELDSVPSEEFSRVVDACTLCDLCFMTKCPYVPPHSFNVDFPHLMLRYRYAELKGGKSEGLVGELAKTDRNGRLGGAVAPFANWATDRSNKLTRPLMEKVADVHRDAALPKFHGRTFMLQAKSSPVTVNRAAPAFGRKAVLYATCFANYHNPAIGLAARAVLARNGVETEVVYPRCCGMPQLEKGDLPRVAETARQVSAALLPWVDKGYDVVALVPSCALMLKFEWPLIVPGETDVKRLAGATFDISEYVVDIARREGLAPGLQPLDGGVALHIACHARAQNMGQKATEMLSLIPGADLTVIERCAGHGGSWGVRKDNFEVALRVGRPVARQAKESGKPHVASECPLAGAHILQGIERQGGQVPDKAPHPIELFARAYGV